MPALAHVRTEEFQFIKTRAPSSQGLFIKNTNTLSRPAMTTFKNGHVHLRQDRRKLLESRKVGPRSLQHVGVIFTMFSFLDPQHRPITAPLWKRERDRSWKYA